MTQNIIAITLVVLIIIWGVRSFLKQRKKKDDCGSNSGGCGCK